MYDKNGIACCTKKLELSNSWLDAGYLKEFGGPLDDWKGYMENNPYLWDMYFEKKWATYPQQIYHAAGEKNNMKPRYNFECPTHHPVPTVAIILGNYI